VARLAGIPAAVLNHAGHALQTLEQRALDNKVQVDLFAAPPASPVQPPSAVEARLGEIDPDTLSPRDALDLLYQLKKISGKA
jgi:DNA mismatch repair protein MutS